MYMYITARLLLVSLFPSVYLDHIFLHIVTFHVHVHQRSFISDYQQKIGGKCQDLSMPEGLVLIVYNKTWENRVILSRHDQVALDIRPRC